MAEQAVTVADPNATVLPVCCGDPMVSYMGGWFFECANAFFTLQDDGAIGDNGETPPRLLESATAEHQALLAHLNETRLSTCEDCGHRYLTQGPDRVAVNDCPTCNPPASANGIRR